MKHTAFLIGLVIAVSALNFGCAAGNTEPVTVSASENVPTGFDREIQNAQAMIELSPDSPMGYASLATAYVKLGRVTGDVDYNSKAQDAVDRGLKVAPADADLGKLKATLLLSGHEFYQALILGKELEKELPKDPYVLGILTDANVELGNYATGVEYVQKLVDIKPGSASYSRVANVRSLHGDHDGAVEMYKLAARTADPADKEAQSWCLSQLGNEYWRVGKYAESERVFDEALQSVPSYHHALFGKGRALASRGEYASAASHLSTAQKAVKSMETAILLRDVFERLGDEAGVRRQAELIESEEQLGSHFDEHRLALYWADHDLNLDRALEIAQADYATQKDIYASDTLAWCLYKKGRFAEAKRMIAEATRLGTRDAKLFYHAGMIESALGNRRAAKSLLEKALKMNPAFDLRQAEIAKKALVSL